MRKCDKIIALFATTVVLAATGVARADEKADALLKEVDARTQAIQTFHAKVIRKGREGTTEGQVFLQRPNRGRVVMKGSGSLSSVRVSDGETLWQTVSDKEFTRSAAPPGLGQLWPFFNRVEDIQFGMKEATRTYRGSRTADGEAFEVVEFRLERPLPQTIRLYISPDRLVRRIEAESEQFGKGETVYTEIQTDQPIDPDIFVFRPTEGMVERKTARPQDIEAGLLGVGKKAPDFTVPTMSGRTLSLKEALRGKKAVLLDFWFYGCPGCLQEFSHLKQLYASLRNKGLEIVAVNQGDSDEIIRKFLKQGGYTFPVAKGPKDGGIFSKYGVVAFPTNYLIDRYGKVVFRSVGFDEQGLKRALTGLGLK
jgi:peroxiredoxin/outer membrane lipoprotein-sorting protein